MATKQQNFFFIGVFGLLCNTAAAGDSLFKQYEVITGSTKSQTVLTGFLLGGAIAELVVLNIDENNDRHVSIHEFSDDTWVPSVNVTLSPDVLFVDVANIGGHDRLILYRPGQLTWFDPDFATEHALVEVTSNFNPSGKEGIPHVDITGDVNGDNRDDLLVPDSHGFWVFIQMNGGAFSDPIKLGLPIDMARIYGADGYRYHPWSQSRIHEVDYNQDGRRDLVFWNKNHFEVHYQDQAGNFAPVAKAFTIDVAFDSDKISVLTTDDMTGTVLHSLSDQNGDGVADLVVFKLGGKRIFRKRSKYDVHFGTPTREGGTLFSRAADTTIQSERIQIGMDGHDFDQDGQKDMLFTTIEVGFFKNNPYRKFRGFMGGEIYVYLEFFRMQGGLYPDQPNTTRRINLQFPGAHQGPGWVPLDLALRGAKHERRNTQKNYRRAFKTPLLIGDVTGDGYSDLLIGWDRDSLPGLQRHPFDLFKVFTGVPGPELFSQQSKDVAVPLPNDGEYVWLADINKDAKQDILLHYTGDRVAILIAQ